MRLVLIGGTGSEQLLPARREVLAAPRTRWGTPSADFARWQVGSVEVCFLARHGRAGAIAPHRIDYRANIAAVQALGPDAVVAINAVGGITPAAAPGRVVLPAQLIDYTWGREHSFCDGVGEPLRHVEFDPPFDESVRSQLAAAATRAGVDPFLGGIYGVTQGPRLETAAEIDRLAADGCDLVGMTAMPEAALAREAALRYALCAVVVNPAAGRLPPGRSIHGEMQRHLAIGMQAAGCLLGEFIAGLDGLRSS
jgi:purine nucleoside phosphorylase